MIKMLGRRLWAKLKPTVITDLSNTTGLDRLGELNDRIVELETLMASMNRSFRIGLDSVQSEIQLDRELAHKRIFLPNVALANIEANGPFLPYSTCSAADFFHPRYGQICEMLRHPHRFHRKLWEWVFIVHHLQISDMLTDGRRGLVFGVGHERLPSLFASLGATITATDAPAHVGVAGGWAQTSQHSQSLEQLRYRDLVADAVFDQKVSYQVCDMNNIDKELVGYDFVWSSCCFEHLGSIEAGIQFVINSVEQTLKIGGIACHTTEYNLSSNDETVDMADTVIYRKQDIESLIQRLRERGHEVKPFVAAPDSHVLDFYVDTPPYNSEQPHLKLWLGKYITTSVGLVIKRGK
ncbi:hypothetical protein SAMN04488135_118100 [Pollutimonas bauzanensis]|uniref:Methyltransferase domain-containing protein n=2 Tax=Pollutimonas bauzanensis TaxID=658167 RepID=A0A1M5ZUQ0_9BURK|nr:hypothetical protein SAMN04488135_118100 [Pollutimonas bauzanensis]